MAVKPQEMSCDFCGAVIACGAKYTKIVLPIPPSVRKHLIEHAEKSILPDMPHRQMFPGLFNADSLVPREWVIEVCVGCTTGLLGDAMIKMQEQIKMAIDHSLAHKRAHDESVGDLEPA